jgi:acyl-CoA synthetase (AMP-forming)/AMP-acid ligase II
MAKPSLPFLPTSPLHRAPADAAALIDDTTEIWLTYGALRAEIEKLQPFFKDSAKKLTVCCIPNSIEGVTAYLAAAASGHAIAMADATMPHFQDVVAAYRPQWVIAPEGIELVGYTRAAWPFRTLQLLENRAAAGTDIHPDLYLLLLTSGSTGNSKGVRLSYKNIASNTEDIVKSLGITEKTCAFAHLPLSYSYGLSVLHMQLAIGGSCVLTGHGMMNREFWQSARARRVTLFPGVPYHYEMLAKLGLTRIDVPDVKTFLQAGGKMRNELTQDLHRQIEARGGEFFIMYGQTEAGPRISCLPLHKHPEKIGSCGQVLPSGQLNVIDDEVIYTGPNVMMGYAEGHDDLARGDLMGGRLATGDMGELDGEGYLYISGRKQRFAKPFGQRVSLDDLERIAGVRVPAAALELGDKIVLAVEGQDRAFCDKIKVVVLSETHLPPTWFDVRSVDTFPRKPNGKIDYARLKEIL